MKTFRQFIREQYLILEDRLNKIKELNKGKIDTTHDTLAKHRDSDDIVDHFATHADPTNNKQYTQWIINKYKQKNFRQEDHPRIKDALSGFEKYKPKLEKKDINQYKSLSDVETAVEPHLGQASSNKEEKRQVKSEGADSIHDDKELGVTVHHLKTKDAACAYGAGTKWCTAAKNNNMFHHYNNEGPLYVIQHDGKKYQFHNETDSLVNSKDEPVSLLNGVHHKIRKSLAQSKHPEITKLNILKDNDQFRMTSEHAGKLVDDKRSSLRKIAARYPEHAGKLVNDNNNSVRELVASHPEHAGKLVNDPNDYVRSQVAKHPEHAGKLVNDNNNSVRELVASHPEHAGKLVNDPDDGVRAQVAKHPEHAGKLVNDPSAYVRGKVAEHPEHAGKLVNDPDDGVREKVAKHPEHAGKLVNDPSAYVRETARKTRSKNL